MSNNLSDSEPNDWKVEWLANRSEVIDLTHGELIKELWSLKSAACRLNKRLGINNDLVDDFCTVEVPNSRWWCDSLAFSGIDAWIASERDDVMLFHKSQSSNSPYEISSASNTVKTNRQFLKACLDFFERAEKYVSDKEAKNLMPE